MNRKTGLLVLRNGALRWSTPHTLNDPYDCRMNLRFDPDDALRMETLRRLFDNFYGTNEPPVANSLGEAILRVRGKYPSMPFDAFR